MKPTKGRIVHYRLSQDDVDAIYAQREKTGQRGNPVSAGEVVPAIVAEVFPDEFGPGIAGCNLKLMLDGEDSFWATSRREGAEPLQWSWPPRE